MMGGPKGKAGGEYQPKKFNSHFNSPFTLRTIFALSIEYEGLTYVKPIYLYSAKILLGLKLVMAWICIH